MYWELAGLFCLRAEVGLMPRFEGELGFSLSANFASSSTLLEFSGILSENLGLLVN